MKFERTHCAASDVSIILRDASDSDDRAGAFKPVGFWYEVNGDWRRWASEEDFAIGSCIFDVELNSCNILKIDTLKKLDAFHAEYHGPLYRSLESIIWSSVKARYDGIEIAPYQWERRLHHDFMWYYGWDCASGVIWRPKDATVTFRENVQPKRVFLQEQGQSA